jgi:hypothetical protein
MAAAVGAAAHPQDTETAVTVRKDEDGTMHVSRRHSAVNAVKVQKRQQQLERLAAHATDPAQRLQAQQQLSAMDRP